VIKIDAVRGLRRTRPSKGGLMDEMLTLDGGTATLHNPPLVHLERQIC
jgi:hypothetical protein